MSGKALPFREILSPISEAPPPNQNGGRASNHWKAINGKAKPFRSSAGKALSELFCYVYFEKNINARLNSNAAHAAEKTSPIKHFLGKVRKKIKFSVSPSGGNSPGKSRPPAEL